MWSVMDLGDMWRGRQMYTCKLVRVQGEVIGWVVTHVLVSVHGIPLMKRIARRGYKHCLRTTQQNKRISSSIIENELTLTQKKNNDNKKKI